MRCMCKYDWRPSFRQHKQKNTLETEVTQSEASVSCAPEEDYLLLIFNLREERSIRIGNSVSIGELVLGFCNCCNMFSSDDEVQLEEMAGHANIPPPRGDGSLEDKEKDGEEMQIPLPERLIAYVNENIIGNSKSTKPFRVDGKP